MTQMAGFAQTRDALTLTANDGTTLLTYSPGLSTIEGTSWKVTGGKVTLRQST